MAATNITDELIDQIAKELAEKYQLSSDQLSQVGKRLSEDEATRQSENDAFADRFMAEHAETFKRLGG